MRKYRETDPLADAIGLVAMVIFLASAMSIGFIFLTAWLWEAFIVR